LHQLNIDGSAWMHAQEFDFILIITQHI